ncbi:hypothetical protein CC80DRAFT_551829 [Byssothecium circinans]|uniref:Uncharacterized protein n=1 Tax=Byssothecium circinans TaxID=147558 RepID=A0A6A5TQQ8_9PLEO|nr:hypothetical protein CC80DRAFT_551829 [Byssothecium circinans]
MWENPPPQKLHSEQLDDIWSWYTDWLDEHDGEMPDLVEEDFDMITTSIEQLLGYVAYLKEMNDAMVEMKDEMHTVKEEVRELKKRKRKSTRADTVSLKSARRR